ncbi:hypothetical protein [Paenibacillus tyrfis]|uniref:hypothetical protein n=1 Tax=Paenibacillus tyrfis TaxID=1501230 RepID=UPI0005699691|nr:hypothetical protein [Paenibacillus tyrfis]
MADLIGSPNFKDRVRKLEESDNAVPETWGPIHQTLINNDVFLSGQLANQAQDINKAQSTANAAATAAQNAQVTADDAKNRAINAQSTADSAKSAAKNAQSTADLAQAMAVNANVGLNDYVQLDGKSLMTGTLSIKEGGLRLGVEGQGTGVTHFRNDGTMGTATNYLTEYGSIWTTLQLRWNGAESRLEFNNNGKWMPVGGGGGLKKVQHGVTSVNDVYAGNSVRIEPVNLDKSYIVISYCGDPAATQASYLGVPTRAYFQDNEHILLSITTFSNTSETRRVSVAWQVIEFQ